MNRVRNPWTILAASLFLSVGCSTADPLDGGGSSELPPYGDDGALNPDTGSGERITEPTGDTPRRGEVLAADQVGPQGMVVHAGVLYWIDIGGTELRAVAAQGGDFAALASLDETLGGAPFDLAVDDLGVLLTDSFGQALYRVPLTGDAVEEIATFTSAPMAVEVVNDVVYVSVDGEGIYEVDVDSGALTQVAAIAGSPLSIAAGGDYLYATTADGALYRTQREGSTAAEKIFSNVGLGEGLAADEQHVYWLDTYSRQVMRAAPGEDAEVVAPFQYALAGLALDTDYAYFTTGGDHAVKRVDKTGGDIVTLAEQQESPESVTSDGSAVFWASADEGVIRFLILE